MFNEFNEFYLEHTSQLYLTRMQYGINPKYAAIAAAPDEIMLYIQFP